MFGTLAFGIALGVVVGIAIVLIIVRLRPSVLKLMVVKHEKQVPTTTLSSNCAATFPWKEAVPWE